MISDLLGGNGERRCLGNPECRKALYLRVPGTIEGREACEFDAAGNKQLRMVIIPPRGLRPHCLMIC